MAPILHIDSSARGERSKSSMLAQEFIEAWKTTHPEATIVYRDIGRNPVPHISEAWIEADFATPDTYTSEMASAIQMSDQLVDEFLTVDRCVFAVPMYNFGVPSVFKAYIDQIVRVNRTFAFDESGFKGLVQGKKILFITSRGVSYAPGSPYAGWDAQEPQLRAAFNFMGVSDLQFIHAEGLDLGDEARERSLTQTREKLQAIAARW
jgi:FMN-dependent NADH-azoreductase